MPNTQHELNVFQDIWSRFCRPMRKLAFYLYFFPFIVILSGGGVILAYFKEAGIDGLPLNLSTYAIALLIPSAMTIILELFKSKTNVPSTISICVIIILSSVGFLVASYHDTLWAAIANVLISWFLWIVANCDNEYMDDIAFSKNIKANVGELKSKWDEE